MKGFRGVYLTSWKVRDDRGAWVRLRWARPLRTPNPETFDNSFTQAWMKDATRDVQLFGMGTWVLVFPGLLGLWWIIASQFGFLRPPLWLYLTAVFLCALLGFYFGMTAAPRLARVLWRRRLCMGCGYTLDGCRMEEDGCTVCPECGGAWAIERRARCGSCDYSFAGLAPDDAGKLACPECGETWTVWTDPESESEASLAS